MLWKSYVDSMVVPGGGMAPEDGEPAPRRLPNRVEPVPQTPWRIMRQLRRPAAPTGAADGPPAAERARLVAQARADVAARQAAAEPSPGGAASTVEA